ncbi:MAG: DUF2007 domain-containing protein [Planctomycetota bacterium]|jgi:hypothetical protein
MSEPVVVHTAANPPEAHLLCAALEAEGIPTHVTNETLQAAAGDLPLGWAIAPRILVPAEHVEEALRILQELGAKDGRTRGSDEPGDAPSAPPGP